MLLLCNYSQNGWFQATYMKSVDVKLERDGYTIVCENVHTSSQGWSGTRLYDANWKGPTQI